MRQRNKGLLGLSEQVESTKPKSSSMQDSIDHHVKLIDTHLPVLLRRTGLNFRYRRGELVHGPCEPLHYWRKWNSTKGRLEEATEEDFVHDENDPSAGLLIEVYREKDPDRTIKMEAFFRHTLADYPRTNAPSDISKAYVGCTKEEVEEAKQSVRKYLHDNDIHFLLVKLVVFKPTAFWTNRYDAIPYEHCILSAKNGSRYNRLSCAARAHKLEGHINRLPQHLEQLIDNHWISRRLK